MAYRRSGGNNHLMLIGGALVVIYLMKDTIASWIDKPSGGGSGAGSSYSGGGILGQIFGFLGNGGGFVKDILAFILAIFGTYTDRHKSNSNYDTNTSLGA